MKNGQHTSELQRGKKRCSIVSYQGLLVLLLHGARKRGNALHRLDAGLERLLVLHHAEEELEKLGVVRAKAVADALYNRRKQKRTLLFNAQCQ